jgi:hypothetical protein
MPPESAFTYGLINNLDDLITIALDDSQAIAQESKAFRGINFVDL